MQKQIEKVELELIERIYKLFLTKFDGNNSEFARQSQCTETTIRRIFRRQQGITFNLLLRFCHSLEIEPSELLNDLSLDSFKDD